MSPIPAFVVASVAVANIAKARALYVRTTCYLSLKISFRLDDVHGPQVYMAHLTLEWTWGAYLVAIYVVGATANHSLFLAIHELSHNLGFKSIANNKLLSMVANLPIGIPYCITFKPYHMEHHRYQVVNVYRSFFSLHAFLPILHAVRPRTPGNRKQLVKKFNGWARSKRKLHQIWIRNTIICLVAVSCEACYSRRRDRGKRQV